MSIPIRVVIVFFLLLGASVTFYVRRCGASQGVQIQNNMTLPAEAAVANNEEEHGRHGPRNEGFRNSSYYMKPA